MKDLLRVTTEQFQNKYWQRFSGYSFAIRDSYSPIVLTEVTVAVTACPLAFVRDDQGIKLVVIQGIETDRNLFVAPSGKWLSSYVPAIYRSYPFALGPRKEGSGTLFIQRSCGLITSSEEGAEPFFDNDGDISAPLRQVVEFLNVFEKDLERTALACNALEESELLVPWEFKFRVGEKEFVSNQFLKVDEAKLESLDDVQFLRLRRNGALRLAYAQSLSMHNLNKLAKLIDFQKALLERAEAESADTSFLTDTETDASLNFDNL